MEEIINKLSQAVKTATPKRNWGVPIAILSAFALIGVGMYYGYFETLFHGAKAASTFTFDFDNENDYNISPNVTVRGGYAMNDLVYTAAESGLNDIPSFTDILAAGPLGDNIIALVSQPNQILHSSDAGANWATIAHPSNPSIIWQKMINGVLLQPNKRIYFFGHTADSNSIGRFTYAQCELANQAACIDPFTQPEPQWSWTVSALGVPNLVSFGDAYTNNINIWAGASVVDPVNPATTNGWVYSADKNLSSGSVTSVELLGTTAVNDIMAAGQYQTIDRYAAVTSRLSGRTGIWYTENNDGIWKEATLDPTDSFSHLSVYSLTKDGAGYIYATTDRSYILKSTIPNGTEFKRTANTDVIGAPMEGAYYAIVHDDNLLVFDKSGRVYRAVDYNSATGFTKLIESNTPFATGGTNFEVADSDYPLLFGNYLYLAVNNLSNNTSAFLRSVYAGYQFPANPFNRTVVNTVGINYTSLSSFDAVVPLSSNGNPRFRLKNYAAGQWRYYDTVNNVWSVSSSQGDGGSNTAQEINAHIGTFAQEFGQGKLFIETILSPKDSELGLVPYILDSVTVNYEANYFNIESVVPNSGPVAGGNTVNINGTDLNEQTRVKFGSHYSPNVNFIDSTHLTAVVPASTLPGDKTGWVDVSILDENTDFTYQKTLSGTNGYHYTAYTVGSIEISDVPEYTALNQAFNLTVTVYDSNHQVLSNFDNETIRIMIDNNDDGIPDTDDGGLLSPSIIQPVDLGPTGWVNGSQTGQFTISVANLPQPPGPTPGFSQHTIVATYSPTISDSATTITVDVEDDTIPVDHFDVTVPLFGVKNTNFPIRVEAKTIQDLVKTNFVPATGNPVRIYADGNADGIDDGVIQPTTIGVINESGEWLNGVASFDAYQISVADTYTIEANYILSPVDIISGTATINISGSSQQLPPQISSVDPTEGPITGGTAVIISGSNFGTAAGPTTDPTIVRFGGVDATNVVVHSTEMITADTPPYDTAEAVDVEVINPSGLNDVLPGGFTYLEGQQLSPQISGIDPVEGPIAGGTAVIISGNNFGTAAGPTTDPTIVRFGGVDATNVVVHSTEMITADTPPYDTAEAVDVEVINPSGLNDVLPGGFTYKENGVNSFAARYRSPALIPVGTIQSLDALTVVASGYGLLNPNAAGDTTRIAVGFFDVNDVGLAPWIAFNPADSGNFANWYAGVISQVDLTKVYIVRFRIELSDGDTTVGVSPWAESITLAYTTETGGPATLALTVTSPTPDHVSMGGSLIYTLTLSGTYVGGVNLSTPVVANNPDYLQSAIFEHVNPVSKEAGDFVTHLTVTVKTWDDATKPTGPFPYTIAFTVIADATTGTPLLQAMDDTSLTIDDLLPGTFVTFKLTVPVEGILADDPTAMAPRFEFRLYTETETDSTKPAAFKSNLDLTTQDITTSTVIIDNVQVLKTSLTDGATYIAYVRSNRHMWAKATTPADGKIQISFAPSMVHELTFPRLMAGDIEGLTGPDNLVDLLDFTVLINFYNQSTNLLPDFDANKIIDILDLTYIFQNWGKTGDTFFNQ